MKPLPLLAVLSAAAATMLVLRLGGVGLFWLPGPMGLAVLLAGLVIIPRLWSTRTPEAWRGWVRSHDFSIGLGLVVLLALIVRLPGLWSDLGHVPIDIDENRLAANVRHFFATGELRHETVEHYPGAVFWLSAAGSLLGYLRGLTSGLGRGPTQLPVELFVESARLANVVVGAAIVFFSGLLGRRLFTPAVGLIAAGIVAVVPLSVDTTVLVRNDAGMVLAVMAAVYFAVLALDDPRRERWLVTSGVLAGVAAGIKYSSVFAVAPPLVRQLPSEHPTRGCAAPGASWLPSCSPSPSPITSYGPIFPTFSSSWPTRWRLPAAGIGRPPTTPPRSTSPFSSASDRVGRSSAWRPRSPSSGCAGRGRASSCS